MVEIKGNPPHTIAKLLRAIAGGTEAKAMKHDVIFTAAADLLDKQAALEVALRELHDCMVPGMTITVGGNAIDHTEFNKAKGQATALLSGLDYDSKNIVIADAYVSAAQAFEQYASDQVASKRFQTTKKDKAECDLRAGVWIDAARELRSAAAK